jgi:hypothetical protein
MLKKAQPLVIAVVAALVVPTAFTVCLDYGRTQSDWSTVSRFTLAISGSPLPELSESVAPSPPSAPEEQSDNTTATVTSGGTVKASFTVVAAPPSNQEESKAAESQAMPDNQARTASQARPESVGFTPRWVPLTSIFSMVIAAIGVLALLYSRARDQA